MNKQLRQAGAARRQVRKVSPASGAPLPGRPAWSLTSQAKCASRNSQIAARSGHNAPPLTYFQNNLIESINFVSFVFI